MSETQQGARGKETGPRGKGAGARGKGTRALGVVDVVMLGFGSIIGAGFFVASGLAVRQAGPGILLAFIIGAIGFVGILTALAEMASANPAPGGFRTYAREALGPYMGFTVGWMYWTSGVLTMSSEVTAAALLATYWLPHWPLWLLSLIFSLLITGINFMDARGFGEVETAFSGIKLFALVAFVAIGAYAVLRGLGGAHLLSPSGPGAGGGLLAGLFPTGARGVAASMLMVMFTYAGVQVVGMVAPDTRNTARTMPRAIGILTVGLIALYLASFAVLLLILPWQQVSTQSSPFVQALQRLGLLWASPVMNLVILTAALSALNSSLYGVTRMLYALSLDREAPRLFKRETRSGIPGWALAGSSAVLVIAIVLAFLLPRQAYLYITSAGGFISMFNWLVIAITHLRYRPLLLRRSPNCLVYRAFGYPVLSWAAILITAGVLLTTPLARGQIVGLVAGVAQFTLVSMVYLLFVGPRERRRARGGGGGLRQTQEEAPPTCTDDGRLPT